jgi:hypothetical protein
MPAEHCNVLTRWKIPTACPLQPGQVPAGGPTSALAKVVQSAKRLGVAKGRWAAGDPGQDVVGVRGWVAATEEEPAVLAATTRPGEDQCSLGRGEVPLRIAPRRRSVAPCDKRSCSDNNKQQADYEQRFHLA